MKYKNTAHFLGDQVLKRLKQKKGQTGKSNITLMIISVIVFLVFTVGMVGFAGYWTGDLKVVNTLNKFLPYPAATVNFSIVSLYDWNFEYKAWKRAADKNGSEMLDSEMRKDVLDKLVKEVFISDLAKKYDIEVTAEEIETELNNLAEQAGGMEIVENDIKELFGWTKQDFAERLLAPELIVKKMSEELSLSEKAKEEAEKKARDVLKKVNKDEDFAELAIEFSDDLYTAENGGEWEWIGRGIVDKKIEDVVFNLQVGEVSDVIETEVGYFIVKLEDKRQVASDPEETVTEGEGESAEQMKDEVKLRAILITPANFQKEINEMIEDAKVYRFIRFEE